MAMLIVPAIFAFGCGKSHHKFKLPVVKEQDVVPGKVQIKGWKVRWVREVNGISFKVLDAEADTGSILNQNNKGLVEMNTVHGKSYQKGLPSNTFIADKLLADQKTKVVIATGHAVITSIDPPGTMISADKILINLKTDKVTCEGHAKVMRTPKSGPALLHEGGKITTNTHLTEITVE